jgi:hypothetical protein
MARASLSPGEGNGRQETEVATKKEVRTAYDAGREFGRTHPDDMPSEAVDDPVGACPFPVGDEQRTGWLEGLQDALEASQKVHATHRKLLTDAIKVEDQHDAR